MSGVVEAIPELPPGIRVVREVPAAEFPLYCHPEWGAAFPWLVQGTTGRGTDDLDLGLFGGVPTGLAQSRWRGLRQVTGMATAVHARQVHETTVVWHQALPPGLVIGGNADGHATTAPNLLLTVSVADCVPVFVVAPRPRAVALLHAGWRGTAGGILERGMALLHERSGADATRLHVHFGPAICGACYEVGVEVAEAVGVPRTVPGRPHLDLRAALAARALRAGVPAEQVTVSGHCTRCGGELFWSHRSGNRERQLGVAGMRAA